MGKVVFRPFWSYDVLKTEQCVYRVLLQNEKISVCA